MANDIIKGLRLELNEDDDTLMGRIKENCVTCGKYNGHGLERYINQGNYCLRCCAKADSNKRLGENISLGSLFKNIIKNNASKNNKIR